MSEGSYKLQQCRQGLELVRPDKVVRQKKDRLAWLVERLNAVTIQRMHDCRNDYVNQLNKLRLLSPDNVLSRGYSITSDAKSGGIIRDVTKVKTGQQIATRLLNSTVLSTVDEIED